MGSMHRNTFIDSPRFLIHTYVSVPIHGTYCGTTGPAWKDTSSLPPWDSGAGVSRRTLREIADLPVPPAQTAFGALIRAITPLRCTAFRADEHQFGLLPPLEHSVRDKDERRSELLLASPESME